MPFSLPPPAPFSITRFNFFLFTSIINQSFAFSPGYIYIVNSGNCRVLAFPSYFLIADRCLVNHTILIVQHVLGMGLCKLLFYSEPNCVSVNYEIQTQKRCELNNSTHNERTMKTC